ncbi:hypothetical protein [Arsukibacterium indicum]|uniref:Uncharacterized protein n=1 Tax=Arsukibacterium indicum TaxID=2848612 RepID=A0ABS6MH71_9GAMM|nr:hypothetical protein [Arsukibacterium indicum]MBV2128165.1 hypothetical protein [Arsukibacterium indicum]
MSHPHSYTWSVVAELLKKERQDNIDLLIQKEDHGVRSVIKFIDEVLDRFPHELAKKE